MPHKVEVAQAHDITLGREASILVTSVPHLPAHPQALEPEDKVASIGSMEGTGEDDEDYEQEQTTNEQLPHHNEALSHESEGGVKGGETVKPHDLKIATSSASASHGVLSSMTVSPISTEPSFALPAASAGDNSEQAKTQHLPHPPHSKPVSAAQKSSSMNQSHNSLLRAKMIQEGQVQHVPLKDNTSSVESNKSLPRNAGGGGGGIAAATAIIASIAPSSKQRSIDDLLNGSKPNQLSSKPTLKEIMTSLTNLVMMEEPDESNTGSVSPSPVVPKPKPLASRSVSLNNFAYSLPTKSHDDLSGYAADVAGGSGTSATGSSLPRRPPPPTRGMSLGSAHSLNASSSTSKSHTTHVNATVAIHSGSGPISTTPTTTTNSNANHPTIDIPKSASEGSVLTPSDPVSASAIKSPSSSLLSPISPSKSGSIRQGGSVLPALAVKKFVDMLNIALSLDPDTHKPSSTVHPKDLVSIICNKNAAQLRQISDAFARRSDITLKLAVAEWSGGEKTHLGRLLEDLLLVGPKEVECKLVNRCLVKREGSSEAREVERHEMGYYV